MNYFRVTGSDTKIRKAIYDLRDCQPVIESKTSFFIMVPESEDNFVNKVASDLGINIKLYGDKLPPNHKLSCGKFYIDGRNLIAHTAHCKICRNSMGKLELKPAITVVKVKGLIEPNINGLLSAMKQRYEEVMALAIEWDSTIRALEGLESLTERTKVLEAEKIEHLKAIKYFMKEV